MIKKQEFYEGAALHQIACGCEVVCIRQAEPFFLINERLLLLLKYCTKGRNPWGFTLTPKERAALNEGARQFDVEIGLICGSDGVAALRYVDLITIAGDGKIAVRIACSRKLGQHFSVSGPGGQLDHKIAPSRWQGLAQFKE